MRLIFSFLLLCFTSFQLYAAEIISTQAELKYIDLEGGFYGLITAKGEKYVPLNLPLALKNATATPITVQIQATKAPQTIGIMQWGTYINLNRISVLPDCKE